MLIIKAMVESQLLLAISWIVEHIQVQRQFTARRFKPRHEPIDEPLFQSQQLSCRDRVLEPRQSRLARQIAILGQSSCDQLHHGV
jgi:hypothetical protein